MTRSNSSSDFLKKRPCSFSSLSAFNSLAAIIGVSVSETTAETRIVTLRVTANSRKSRPTMSAMKSSGMSTAIRETVSETMVKPICFEPLFDISRDVLDHDDGVVDDEACGDRQGHQREVVERVAQQVHHTERADDRQWHSHARDDRCGDPAQKQEDHQHDESNREQELVLHVAHRRPDGHGAVSEDGDVHARRETALQLRQKLLDAIDDVDDVRARLALNVHDDGGRRIHPRRLLRVFHAVDDAGHVGHTHRRAVAIGDDDRLVVRAGEDLVVRPDAVALLRSLQIALGLIGIRRRQSAAQILEAQSVRGQSSGIGLHTHGGLLSAADGDETDTRQLRDLLREGRVGQVLDFTQRERARSETEGEDGGVGRVGLAVDRRFGKVAGQEAGGGVDRRLHFLLGNVDVLSQVELQRDHRAAERTGGAHLL